MIKIKSVFNIFVVYVLSSTLLINAVWANDHILVFAQKSEFDQITALLPSESITEVNPDLFHTNSNGENLLLILLKKDRTDETNRLLTTLLPLFQTEEKFAHFFARDLEGNSVLNLLKLKYPDLYHATHLYLSTNQNIPGAILNFYSKDMDELIAIYHSILRNYPGTRIKCPTKVETTPVQLQDLWKIANQLSAGSLPFKKSKMHPALAVTAQSLRLMVPAGLVIYLGLAFGIGTIAHEVVGHRVLGGLPIYHYPKGLTMEYSYPGKPHADFQVDAIDHLLNRDIRGLLGIADSRHDGASGWANVVRNSDSKTQLATLWGQQQSSAWVSLAGSIPPLYLAQFLFHLVSIVPSIDLKILLGVSSYAMHVLSSGYPFDLAGKNITEVDIKQPGHDFANFALKMGKYHDISENTVANWTAATYFLSFNLIAIASALSLNLDRINYLDSGIAREDFIDKTLGLTDMKSARFKPQEFPEWEKFKHQLHLANNLATEIQLLNTIKDQGSDQEKKRVEDILKAKTARFNETMDQLASTQRKFNKILTKSAPNLFLKSSMLYQYTKNPVDLAAGQHTLRFTRASQQAALAFAALAPILKILAQSQYSDGFKLPLTIGGSLSTALSSLHVLGNLGVTVGDIYSLVKNPLTRARAPIYAIETLGDIEMPPAESDLSDVLETPQRPNIITPGVVIMDLAINLLDAVSLGSFAYHYQHHLSSPPSEDMLESLYGSYPLIVGFASNVLSNSISHFRNYLLAKRIHKAKEALTPAKTKLKAISEDTKLPFLPDDFREGVIEEVIPVAGPTTH